MPRKQKTRLFPGDGVGMRMQGKTQNFFVRHPSAFRSEADIVFKAAAKVRAQL